VNPLELAGINEPIDEASLNDRSARGGEATTVEETVNRAVARDAAIAALRARVTAAKVGVEAAGALPNPEIRVTQLRLDEFRDDHAPMDFDLRARFPRLGEPGVGKAIARADLREVESDLRATQRAVEMEIRTLIFDAVILEKEVEAAQQLAQIQNLLFEIQQRRIQQRVATEVEASLQDLERQVASEKAAVLKGRRQAVLEALALRTGASSIDLPALEEVLPGPGMAMEDLPDRKAALLTALRHSPELDEAAARIDRAAAAVWLEKVNKWPWFSFVQGGCEIDQGSGEEWTAGVALDLPVFFGTNQAELQHAEAEQTQAEFELDAVAQRIVADFHSRYDRLKAAAEALDQAVQGSGRAAERAVAAVENAMQVGQADSMEILKVKARRAEVELRILRLLRRYCDARLNMPELQ